MQHRFVWGRASRLKPEVCQTRDVDSGVEVRKREDRETEKETFVSADETFVSNGRDVILR